MKEDGEETEDSAKDTEDLLQSPDQAQDGSGTAEDASNQAHHVGGTADEEKSDQSPTDSGTADEDQDEEEDGDTGPDASHSEEEIRERVRKSKLYVTVEPHQWPIVYSPHYNISFLGFEKLHPFDSGKWGKVYNFLKGMIQTGV